MEYTPPVLFIVGIAGILLSNLYNLDSRNRANKGVLNLGAYIALEKITILINVIIVGLCAFIMPEEAKAWVVLHFPFMGSTPILGASFLVLGLSGQQILVKFMGKSKEVIDKKMAIGSNLNSMINVALQINSYEDTIQSINGQLINKTAKQLSLDDPSYQCVNGEEDELPNLCQYNVPEGTLLNAQVISVENGSLYAITSVEFIGQRPPRRPR